MNVLIAHFIQYNKNSNNRFEYLFNNISNKKDILFISSSFDHNNKFQRNYNPELGITLAYEPGYPKNTSIKRLFSHFIFGLSIFLKLIKVKPNNIYFSFPSISTLLFVSLYKKFVRKDAHLTIDIQDLWPESYQMINQNLPIRVLSKLQEFVIKISAKAIDEVVACSMCFGNHFTTKYKINKPIEIVYIGTDVAKYEKATFSGQAKIVYVGNISKSYDLFKTVDLIGYAKHYLPGIELDIIGDGDDFKLLKDYSIKKKIHVNFLGYKDLEYIKKNLKNYQFAINPIIPKSVSSILNKVADYSAAGLPIINTQSNPEFQKLLESFRAGENFDILEQKDILNFIKKLTTNETLWKKYSKGSINLAKAKFDRNFPYLKLEEKLFLNDH